MERINLNQTIKKSIQDFHNIKWFCKNGEIEENMLGLNSVLFFSSEKVRLFEVIINY